MTHPQAPGAVPPPPAPPPPPPASAPAPPPAVPAGVPPRRATAVAGTAARVRAAATTEPGRLRVIGAVLALLVVAFGAVATWQTAARGSAADDVLHHSGPLSSAAADVYRALAGANTAASSGLLAGGNETPDSRERYEEDIRTAANGLATAAASSDRDSASGRTVAHLNELLPRYKGLVERARANNRMGYPLAGAYLRYADELMREEMLPAAEDLYLQEDRRLREDYADATPYPWFALALGVAALAALGAAQRREYRRTNRVLSPGLVTATSAVTVVLMWLLAGHTLARTALEDSHAHGVESLSLLNDARTASLQARGAENLTLVNRGAETVRTADGVFRDKFEVAFEESMTDLSRTLDAAARTAGDPEVDEPVETARSSMLEWRKRHEEARRADDAGDYQEALDRIIGPDGERPTRVCFDNVDRAVRTAMEHEKTEFRRAATDGRAAMSGLPAGAAVLAALAAAAGLLGIGRRLSEYR
ncbi:hypothetical protein [Streptomyces sp. MJP52]|uniref:hypothetical protein n=1 Tax=Streptomyces sp. MJP52 TaxID=2940555 RepID=UPI0024739982|nr:hypothetical protein [Streptomyces sp. MJP52]MDH6226935.1 hypothetical protein [Streptomyces sp. MJP52]